MSRFDYSSSQQRLFEVKFLLLLLPPLSIFLNGESLIGLVNQIQRACTVLGDYGGGNSTFSSSWEALPSVAVGGGQPRFGRKFRMKLIRLAGRSKMISSVPIHFSIYSPNEGQPESIVEDIENMVRSYVEKPNSIILSISPANQSLHLMLPNLHGKWMQQVNERLG